MATNDPNVPDNVTYIDPGNKTPEEKDAPDLPQEAGGEAPAPELTAEEAAALAGEGEKARRDIGEEQIEPPAPFDIPGPGNMGEAEKTAEPDKETAPPAPETPAAEEQTPAKKGRGGRPPKADKAEKVTEPPDKAAPAAESQQKKRGGKPPKADKADKSPDKSRAPTSPEYEKALAEYNKANAKYKKDLNKWANQQPGDNIEQPTPPVRPKPPKKEKDAGNGKQQPADKTKAPAKEEAPPAPATPEQPPAPPRDATRNGQTEQIVYLNISELHAFKNHPFGVRDDSEMKALVESVKNGGVNQPALVRPREDGGYEIVAGHRRQKASELAGYANMPCIVREMTDDEAIIAMTDDNLRQRSEILPSEKAVSLKMQLEAISHQGARGTSGQVGQKEAGQRSVDIVAERNGMSAKQVQRYINLSKLVPEMQKMVDEKQLGFTQAVEFSMIKPKNQNLIAVSIEGEQAKPSLSQAQRLRELDQKGQLNGDVIDGILSEEKKEVDKVVISGAELDKYFGKDKTPREMKDQIMKLLDDWAGKEKEHAAPEQKPER